MVAALESEAMTGQLASGLLRLLLSEDKSLSRPILIAVSTVRRRSNTRVRAFPRSVPR